MKRKIMFLVLMISLCLFVGISIASSPSSYSDCKTKPPAFDKQIICGNYYVEQKAFIVPKDGIFLVKFPDGREHMVSGNCVVRGSNE